MSAAGTRIRTRAASTASSPIASRDFSASIAAFWRDMGDDAENITLVTMSEFGRTARENGTGGTDHGHANAMFVLGGNVKGGKVYGTLARPRQRPAQRRPRPRRSPPTSARSSAKW